MILSLLKLLVFCHSLCSIYSEDVNTGDPLYLVKKYYHDQEEYKEHKIPVVDNFNDEYDFIIIGSGSGGSVMANRLSENPNWKVLLLEAGEPGDFITDIPLISRRSIGTKYDWQFKIEKSSRCCQNNAGVCEYPRGKALGGCSVINGMAYVRGNKNNFDEWEKLGNPGWSYKDVLRYFKKSEDMHIQGLLNSSYHSQGGNLWVENSHYYSELSNLYLEAGQELGYDTVDYNGESQMGFSRMQITTKHGRRCSAAKAYLEPVSYRRNLEISTSVFVTRIVINSITKVAEGVEFKKNGLVHKVGARKEVILSAGTINSPKILMLSGIGPKDHLGNFDIKVIKDLPVGKGMRDHVGIPGLNFVFDGTLTINHDVLKSFEHISDYFDNGNGPFTVAEGSEVFGFLKSKFAKDDIDLPDIELIFSIANINMDLLRDNANRNIFRRKRISCRSHTNKDYYKVMIVALYAKSEGKIELQSKDPEDQPKIYTNCLSEKYDTDVLIDGLKMAMKVARTKTFSKYNTTLNRKSHAACDHLQFESNSYWKCIIRNEATILQHQIGTCKMGPGDDQSSVVDHTLKVHGIKGLRVVDASIMPALPGAHTNAVVYMIGEKAADMVKAEWLDLKRKKG